MAFEDPQIVTVNAVDVTLPRTGQGENKGSFTSGDGSLKLTFSHAYNKRTRRSVRVDSTKVDSDPLVSGLNTQYSMSVYLVVDAPKVGYSIAEQSAVAGALLELLSADSGAALVKMLGGES